MDRPWNENADLPYSITLWGSHPNEGNDDCWCGEDFASEAEARAALPQVLAGGRFPYVQDVRSCYVMLNGPGVVEVTAPTPAGRRRAERRAHDEREADRRERAMEAGMAFGCDGYNDVMGC